MDEKMRCAAAVLAMWSGSYVVRSNYFYVLVYLVVLVDLWLFLVCYRCPITVA